MERLVSALHEHAQPETIFLSDPILSFENGIKIIPKQHKVLRDEIELSLSSHEYSILCLLAQHPGWVLSKEQIFEAVWNMESNSCFHAVTNAISRLRKKIEPNPQHPIYIQTVPGHGYKFSPTAISNE